MTLLRDMNPRLATIEKAGSSAEATIAPLENHQFFKSSTWG